MRKRFFSFALVAALLFLATPLHAAPSYYDGNFTNLLLKGYLSGQKGATLDNLTTNYWKATLPAAGVFQIVTGNLQVGSGTPTVSLNGQDAYVTGTFEVDGAVRFDNSSLTLRGVAYTLPAADGAASSYLQTNGSGALSWASGTSGSLDDAYNGGVAITADAGAVAITNNAADNNGVLTLTKNPVGAQSGDALTITVGAQATGDALQFANTGSGNDIAGSGGTWSISKAGVATFTSFAPLTGGLSISGGAVNLNASSNNATNINTGTSSGAVSIGGGTGTVAVNSSSWDISTTGAVSGVSTISMTDDLSLANGKAIKGSTTNAETIAIQSYDVDGAAYRNSILLTNGNNPAIAIGTNNETVAINSADWDISTSGDMTGIGAITMDGLLTGTLGATISGAAVNLNASSNFAVNIGTGTSTGTVTIGGAGAQQVDIANGAAAKTLNLGSSNTTSSTTLLSGSGGINLNADTNQPVNIGTGTSTGTVTIGGAGAQSIAIGDGAAAKTVSLGSSNTTSSTTLLSGSGALNLNVNNNQPTNIGSGTTTGTITIGGAGNQTLDIGNGAAVKAVNLGSSNTTSTTTLLSGSGGIKVNESNNQPVDIGTGTSTGTVTIGGGAAQTITIGNGAAAKAVTLGSTNTTSATTINAGSGNINLVGNVSAADNITGDGTGTLGGFLMTVTDDTNGKTLNVNESGTVQTNAGAGGAAAWNLPDAAAGLTYTFVVMAAQELRITPAGGDKIIVAGTAGDAAEYWYSATVGHSITIVAVDGTNWIATAYTGTWAQQTP